MSDHQKPSKQDRSLEKALTNKIIDEYFDESESWLRAILRMCIFSLAHIDGETVFVVECPNQAVARRLSRKSSSFRGLVYFITDEFNDRDRTLFCYKESNRQNWRCFDTSTNSWHYLSHLRSSTSSTDF